MARFTPFFVLAAVLFAACHAYAGENPHGSVVESAVKGILDLLPVPHSRRRALLQGTSAEGEEQTSSKENHPQCAWDEDRKECAVNPLLALGFLEKAPDTKLKELIVDMVKCHFKQDKDTCAEESKCIWDGTYNTCDYAVDVTEMDSFRKCVGVASVFLETDRKIAQCRESFKTEDSCNISKECGWNLKSKTCSFDILKYLTGIPSSDRLPRGLDALLLYRGEEIGDALQSEEITSAEQLLEWTPPPFTCPDGVDQIVCHVAEQSDEMVITDLYCGLKEAIDGVCDEDELCETDKNLPEDAEVTCAISEKLQAEARRLQREEYLGAISSPVAANVMRKEFECLEGDKDTCDGDCQWEDEVKTCGISGAYLFKTMASQPVNYEGDATCHLVQQMFLSGCLEIKEEECGTTPETNSCQWDAADELCIPGPIALMDILFEGDAELKEKATELLNKCHSAETESDCA